MYLQTDAPAPTHTEPRTDIAARVDRGIEALDAYHPDWADHIDLDDLDMTDGWYCIIGQAVDVYHRGIATLSGADTYVQWGVDHGFDGHNKEMGLLRAEWVRRIEERRAAA